MNDYLDRKITKEQIKTALLDFGIRPYAFHGYNETDYHEDVYALIYRIVDAYDCASMSAVFDLFAASLTMAAHEKFILYVVVSDDGGPEMPGEGLRYLQLVRFGHKEVIVSKPNTAEEVQALMKVAEAKVHELHAEQMSQGLEVMPINPMLDHPEGILFDLGGEYMMRIVLYNANIPNSMRITKYPSGEIVSH